ncbi:N-(5'-phosphoribosyl)anthranilate isomerase [Saprospira grandis]|nr:N-(5'-phosphoribosyl)anthranilate isomerase [Saprospira grandis]
MLKTMIKASQMANLTDARYFAAWGVEYMGFCIDPNAAEALSITEFKAMKEWLVGPQIVGEFMGLNQAEELLPWIEKLGLQAIQLGPFSSLTAAKELAQHTQIIKEDVLESLDDLSNLASTYAEWQAYTTLFLLDLERNNMHWKDLNPQQKAQLAELAQTYPLCLSLPFEASELDDILALGIKGLSLKGGEEEKVGYKSFDELDDIYEVLMED